MADKELTASDIAALREKYLIERDKRIRRDGNAQYIKPEGDYADYIADPFVEPGFNREPINDEVDVAIIGAGMGGLISGVRLRQAGIKDIRVIDQAGDFGGTWYWNRFPGAMCDVESYIYMPFLEELDYIPTEKYASGTEILNHMQAVADKFELYNDTCFQTEVTEVRWDEARSRWIISTDRDDSIAARFICMSNGILHRSKLPAIPGINDFKGHAFHTSRWDYEYTGGDPFAPMTGLADKNVAVIGTGATAIQCIPPLAESAKHLYVFQRTPSSIDVRDNGPTDPQWAAQLEPGWQKKRMENFDAVMQLEPVERDMVHDGWTDVSRQVGEKLAELPAEQATDRERIAEILEVIDYTKMEDVRARAEREVRDRQTAESLKPWYRQMCKRPGFHDEYLPAFNRDNVTLVDTDGKGVERVTPNGVVANGQEYPVDCIIFATGFEFVGDISSRMGYPIVGRGGQLLEEKYSEAASTFMGVQTRGFPNCLIMGNYQSAFTTNFPHTLDEQALHIAYIIRTALDRGINILDVSVEAEQQWVETILAQANTNEEFQKECTPGYYNSEGKYSEERVLQNSPYINTTSYFKILREWRDGDKLAGLEVDQACSF